ncbi:MAG: sigma-70 family RNA polymerase sigma factor [Coriobacteriia bacterium]|nr:sigma-70 family RNA polymerase sigma factor [Coriobacteriia bacterium]
MTAIDERHIDRLVRRSVRGDAEAFGRIFDIYVDRVFAYAYARLRDPHEAEDVTETVFLKAFAAIRTYDRRGVPFGAWLFRIARNTTVDHVRRTGWIPQPVDDLEELAGPDPIVLDEEIATRLDSAVVRSAVRNLTEDQAAVIACRFFWDVDIRQTAQTLDRTEGSVKALQHRALRALARLLEEMSADE